MLIPFGVFSAAGAGGGASAGDYELIQSNILGSDTSSITFSSIPSTYKHLQVRMVAAEPTGGNGAITMRFNGDSAGNYSMHYLEGRGSSVVSGSYGTSATEIYALWSRGLASYPNQWGAGIVDILDYRGTKNKTVRSLNGQPDSRICLWSGAWYSTSAVTSITFNPLFTANIASGSRFSLYGIKG